MVELNTVVGSAASPSSCSVRDEVNKLDVAIVCTETEGLVASIGFPWRALA